MRNQILAAAIVFAATSPAAATDWSGFYGGVNFGYGHAHDAIKTRNNLPSNIISIVGNSFGVVDAKTNDDGVLGGFQFGYNYKLNSSWLAGIEADLQYSNISGGKQVQDPYFIRTTMTGSIDWLSTLRGRLGFVRDNDLWFVTGGLALARDKVTVTSTHTGCYVAFCVNPFDVTMGQTGWKDGWVVGGGLEHAMDARTSLRFEYLHVDLGGWLQAIGFQPARSGGAPFNPPFTARFTSHSSLDLVRVGLNFKLN